MSNDKLAQALTHAIKMLEALLLELRLNGRDPSLQLVKIIRDGNAALAAHEAAKRIADMLQRRALSSAPAQPVREPMWQPVETAPKDGRKLLLWWAGMSRVGRCAGVGAARDGGDWWQVPSLECAPTGRPTHWMPLPAAPGATAEQAPVREPMSEEQVEQARQDWLYSKAVPNSSAFVCGVRFAERHHGITKE